MVTFFTRLSPEYLKRKLHYTCVDLDKEGYHGEYYQDYFILSYDPAYGRHPFKRVFYGTIKPVGSGSVVFGRFTYNPFSGLLVKIWFFSVLLFLSLGLLKALERYLFYTLLSPLCAALAVGIFFVLGFVFSYEDEKKVWLFFLQNFEATYFKKN
jgi:hypothetical protein